MPYPLRKPFLGLIGLLSCTLFFTSSAAAFCGFYVAKADSNLYNKASQVVMVRHEDKTVISMMNDFEGSLEEFAMVVPVPEILKEGQINVGDRALFSRIDSFTAPRLVEYFDPDPCMRTRMLEMAASSAPGAEMLVKKSKTRSQSLGVSVEAEYTIGEYDIVILSAKESNGLETWLIENGYNIPKGAKSALAPYIKQELKFFVAKVNLEEQKKTGLQFLRPLQFAFTSEKFMLPIRLGMINAKGPQDLLLNIITKKGRVETTNYPTVKLPTGMDLPVHVKAEFGEFYKAMFDEQVKKHNMKAVFTEYFWDMGWCDPCAAEPLSRTELRKLGVFWLGKDEAPGKSRRVLRQQGVEAAVTRLHLRYTNETFPEDLMFQETGDKTNFQGRYVLRHSWKGERNKCEAAANYLDRLPKRHEQEAQTLANLTGWDVNDVRKKMNLEGKVETKNSSNWWEGLW